MANYIDAEEFKQEVVTSQQLGYCTPRLGELLLTLHEHILTMARFVKKPPHIKEEIKSYSIHRILKRGILTYDVSSTAQRCFNYFTTATIMNYTRCLQAMDCYAKRHQKYIDDVYQEFRENQPYSLI